AILTAQVESLDADKPAVVFKREDFLKGKVTFEKLAINLTGDSDAKKLKHTPQLLKRLAPKLPIVIFLSKNGNDYVAFGYTNGTWFQFTGQQANDSKTIRWTFTHCEPYLRRTFSGKTAELKRILMDVLAGKKEPPSLNPKEKPGLGPEVTPQPTPKNEEGKPQARRSKMEDGRWRIEDRGSCAFSILHPPSSSFQSPSSILHSPPSWTTGPLFAVIPTVFVGGPLAVLAMLFPTVFGGWKRWLALISVACTVSTLYFVQWFFSDALTGS